MPRSFAFTLDLESDYASLTPTVRNRILERPDRVRPVLQAFSDKGARGTAYVVGQVIERYPAIIDLFEEFKWEFELHSYSHDTSKPDSAEELELGRQAFFRRFGRHPIGYRAPQGRITREGIARLAALGFRYDASIFASYFPHPIRNLATPRTIHFWDIDEKTRMLEIPFTSVSPARLTLSTSYMKLMGPAFYRAIRAVFGFPEVICFDSHLHDFVVEEDSYAELSPFWRFIYGRNKYKGVSITTDLFDLVKSHGYEMRYMSEVAEEAHAVAGNVARVGAAR
ncbi:MAG: polysaccharide deacetylase family protein [Vicinamibacteria bacterium]